MKPTTEARELTTVDLRSILTRAFGEAKRARFEPSRAELACKVLAVCHNIPSVLASAVSGEAPLHIPSGTAFASIDEFWRLDLVPAFAFDPAVQAWANEWLAEYYGVSTTVVSAPS